MRMIAKTVSTLVFILISCALIASQSLGEDRYKTKIKAYSYRYNDLTVIGEPVFHIVRSEDTLLDIARDHGLGYNEMALCYPQMDPWIPPAGERRVM